MTLKRFEVEDNVKVVGNRIKKALADELDEKLKTNTLCKKCKK